LNIVESVCKKIIQLADDKELEIILSGGADELISRYTSSQKINIKAKFSKDSKIFKVHVKK